MHCPSRAITWSWTHHNRRLRRRGHEVLFTPGQAFMQYGFGNTLDKTLTAVVGCKERGRQVDGPLDHSTGKGWVKDHAYGKGWVKTDTGWKWMGAHTTTRSGSRKP